jgi:hypothetical protein
MSETTTTTTISDFLLARIAEDEAVASEDAELTIWGKRPNLEQSLYTWGNDYGGGFGITQSRVLAECEAKRQIVEGFVQARQLADSLPGVDTVAVLAFSAANAFLVVLYALASVYADHHDYQQEWRL